MADPETVAAIVSSVSQVLTQAIAELPELVGLFKGADKKRLIEALSSELRQVRAVASIAAKHRNSLEYASHCMHGWMIVDKSKEHLSSVVLRSLKRDIAQETILTQLDLAQRRLGEAEKHVVALLQIRSAARFVALHVDWVEEEQLKRQVVDLKAAFKKLRGSIGRFIDRTAAGDDLATIGLTSEAIENIYDPVKDPLFELHGVDLPGFLGPSSSRDWPPRASCFGLRCSALRTRLASSHLGSCAA